MCSKNATPNSGFHRVMNNRVNNKKLFSKLKPSAMFVVRKLLNSNIYKTIESYGDLIVKKYLALLVILLLLMTGCTDQPELPTQVVPMDMPSEQFLDILSDKTVLTIELSSVLAFYYRPIIHAFENLHPDIRINLNTFPAIDSFSDTAQQRDVAMRLATEFMSGGGPDIVDSAHIPFFSYARLGYFEDLYYFIDRDEDINRNDFYSSILKSLETGGELFRISNDYNITFVSVNVDYVDLINRHTINEHHMTLQRMHEIASEIDKRGLFSVRDLSENNFAMNYITNNISRYYNLSDKYVNFNKEFISAIQGLKIMRDSFESYEEPRFLFEGMRSFVNFYFFTRMLLPGRYEERAFIMLNDEGNHIGDANTLSINSNSENKDLAWEFIMFAMSYDGFRLMPAPGIPIRRSVTARLLSSDCDEENQLLKVLEDLLDNRIISTEVKDPFFLEIVSNAHTDYVAGIATLEEFAATLQERLTIYVHQ